MNLNKEEKELLELYRFLSDFNKGQFEMFLEKLVVDDVREKRVTAIKHFVAEQLQP